MKVSYGELVLLGELFVNYFFKKNYKWFFLKKFLKNILKFYLTYF